jgi:hypothetical protein
MIAWKRRQGLLLREEVNRAGDWMRLSMYSDSCVMAEQLSTEHPPAWFPSLTLDSRLRPFVPKRHPQWDEASPASLGISVGHRRASIVGKVPDCKRAETHYGRSCESLLRRSCADDLFMPVLKRIRSQKPRNVACHRHRPQHDGSLARSRIDTRLSLTNSPSAS